MVVQKKMKEAVMIIALMLCVAGMVFGAGSTEVYPSRDIKLIVGFAPGGVGDLTARIISPYLSERLGRQILIENRPGAGGIIAAQAAVNSPADGYTLFSISNANALSESLYLKMPYDIIEDFDMISTVGFFELAVYVNGNSPIQTFEELIAYVKANPGKTNIGTINTGTIQNIAAELLRTMAGIDAVIVPYKGSGDVLTAVRSNDVLFAIDMLAPLVSQIRSGTVRVLATTEEKRFSGTPDIPTVAESGVPGYKASSWNTVSAPKGTPKEIIDRLNKEILEVLALPDVQQKLIDIGVTARGSSPEEMKQFIVSEVKKWGEVIESAGIPKQ